MGICKKFFRKRILKIKRGKEWWDLELQAKKSTVGRLRKNWQKERAGRGTEEQRRKQLYVQGRANYKKTIREKRKDWEKKILDEVRESEP